MPTATGAGTGVEWAMGGEASPTAGSIGKSAPGTARVYRYVVNPIG